MTGRNYWKISLFVSDLFRWNLQINTMKRSGFRRKYLPYFPTDYSLTVKWMLSYFSWFHLKRTFHRFFSSTNLKLGIGVQNWSFFKFKCKISISQNIGKFGVRKQICYIEKSSNISSILLQFLKILTKINYTYDNQIEKNTQ